MARDKVTTPVMIRAQATILIMVTVSPNSSTPQIILVIDSKVVKIAAVDAPTCLMPICSSDRATTVHSRAKTVEMNQACGVSVVKVNSPVPMPKIPIAIEDISAT